MSIRFKFRSSVNFDTVDIKGRSSISLGELRAIIIRNKKLYVCQDFDLVFFDPVSGQEFDDHSTRISSGSSVIIKRVPAGKAPSTLRPIDVDGNLGVKDSHAFSPWNDQADVFDDLGPVICSVPKVIVPGCSAQLDKEKCQSSQKANTAAPRIEGPKFDSGDAVQDVPRGYNASANDEKIEELLKLKKVTAPDCAPKEINGLPSELKCSLCNTYFKEAVMIPCCQHSFCSKCIRLVLVEKARCPKCLSCKCKVEDLLPNLSLRQAIKHFLESQIPSDSPEIDLCKYAPDGESGIQGEDVPCAVTVLQRVPEPHHSPSATGTGSNLVMEEPFYSSVFRRNAFYGASDYRMSDLAAGREMSKSTIKNVTDIPGRTGVYYTHQISVQNVPKDLDHTADCQGEFVSLLPQPDEAYSTGKRKRSMQVETEAGGDENYVAAGRPHKVIRTCYMCGSPGHVIRDCPVGSSAHSMPQTGPGMLQDGFPGYAPSYWNGAVFPPTRPFPNIYPHIMPFSACVTHMMRYRAPPYVPSVYGALAPSGRIMRMGIIAPPAGSRAEHPIGNPEYLVPLHCEKMKKLVGEELHRGQNCDEEDYANKHCCYQELERPVEDKVCKERAVSVSHSGNSFVRRSRNHQHGKQLDSGATRCEKRSGPSIAGRGQKLYSERADSGMQHRPNSDRKNGEVRYKQYQRNSRKHNERKGESHSDSSHGHRYQSDRDGFRWRTESNVRSSHRKQSSFGDSGLKLSSPGVDRKRPKDRDSDFERRHPRPSTKHCGEDLQDDRWQMISRSGDHRGDYFRHKRKRIH